jgi:hypothetical protein
MFGPDNGGVAGSIAGPFFLGILMAHAMGFAATCRAAPQNNKADSGVE